MRKFYVLCSGIALLTLVSAAAWAQESDTTPPENRDDVLENVVVTSQRRVENLQEVPIAVTAIDAAGLSAKAITKLYDLQTASPSLSITDKGQTQSVNIRGIGFASNSPNATAGVAIYVDGLFQPPIAQASSFYDLSSIEVFRGPQGTLVGTSSTGGAIFINSKSPVLTVSDGYAQLAAGNHGAFNAEGALNIPATDSLAFRVAGFHRDRDSFYTDVGPFNNDAGKLDENGGRIGALWKPGSFSAQAKLQYNDLQTGGYAFRPIAGTHYAAFRTGGIRTLSYDTPTSHRERATIASLELKEELPSGVILRSLSGYQYKRVDSIDDLDGSQAPAAAGGQVTWNYMIADRHYSEELNVISPTDGVFDWILGGYLQRNNIEQLIRQDVAGFPSRSFRNNRRTTSGVFAQGNYALSDSLELQLGSRYSRYKVTGEGAALVGIGVPGFPPGGLRQADLRGEHEDSRVTGKVALNWQLDEQNLLYVFAARGYKPGGFNSIASQFDPETVWNYEAGWKSTLMEGQLRTQLAAFYNDYSAFQFDVLNGATGIRSVRNIASATIKGVEAQIEAQFGELAVNGGMAYVDSKLDGLTFINERLLPAANLGPQCAAGVPSNPPRCFDYSSSVRTTVEGPNMYSPKWTYNIGADYTFRLTEETTLTPRVNYAYMGSQFTYIAYSPVSDRIGSYGLVSALLTLSRGAWRVEAYGTNLTDKEYMSGQASSSRNAFYGAPREYGLRVETNF